MTLWMNDPDATDDKKDSKSFLAQVLTIFALLGVTWFIGDLFSRMKKPRKRRGKRMGYRDRTYVIFDADEDMWAYAYMKGWNVNERLDFDFDDAHEIKKLTPRAEDETYIKYVLRERMHASSQVIVLLGENTKRLVKYVKWEIELALDLGLPIVVANLNGSKSFQGSLCPASLKNELAVHIPFKMRAIQYALDNWPSDAKRIPRLDWQPRVYIDRVYSELGL